MASGCGVEGAPRLSPLLSALYRKLNTSHDVTELPDRPDSKRVLDPSNGRGRIPRLRPGPQLPIGLWPLQG